MINISNDTLLITILVGILAVYTIITLDDKKKERFTETSQDSTDTNANTNANTDADANTNANTDSNNNANTNADANTDADTNADTNADANTSEGNGTGDAGSNTEAVSEESKQDIVQTNDKKTTVIHNHYYGGNKQLAKFMNELVKKQNEEENNNTQQNLVDQGMCSELNNKLKTKTLAEIQNDRVLSDLKNKCDKWSYSQDTCKIQPPLSQTALIGTLLTDAKDTGYGSLLPKVKSM